MVFSTKLGLRIDRATGIDIFSDRRGEVQAAMGDVGYGGSNWN